MAGRIRHYFTETLLWAAAALGLIALVLVFCAYFFNISIILFRTGSMEPTIPAGSAALVQEVEASAVEVGDVLTVDRPGVMPVTHRVTSVESGETADQRVITMQGDANNSPDPSPYVITEGKVLLGSVPGLANPINQMGSPYVMGGITLAASVLVGWAFWPKNGGGSGQRPSSKTTDRPSRPRHAGTSVGILAVVITAAAVMASPEPAFAQAKGQGDPDLVEETITSDFITLTSVYAPSTRQNLAPGRFSEWDVGIDVDGPTEGEVRTGLSSTGDLPMEVTVLACSAGWTNSPSDSGSGTDDCSASSHVVVEDRLVSPGEEVEWIDDYGTEESVWLRLVVSLPDTGDALPASTAGLRLHAQAWGEEVSTGPDDAAEPPSPSPSEYPVDGVDAPVPDADAPPTQDQDLQNGALARTGFSLLALLAAAVLSMLVGRWLKARSAKTSASQDSEDVS